MITIRLERWILVPAALAFVFFAFGSVGAVLVATMKLLAVYFLVGGVGELACYVRGRHVT